jgi:MoxR-like ATPase
MTTTTIVSERVAVSVRSAIDRIMAAVAGALRGKPDATRLALAALLARGHLLIEDVPGVGKTTLAAALARVVGGAFRRVQFTADLMPSDLTGVSIYDHETGRFKFRPGPIFANVLLADEINRATPKTQSAMLEAMNEQRVSVDGVTRNLPDPYFVVATQNPAEQHGTFPLPESQLDRFLLRIHIGYPDRDHEKQILAAHGRTEREEAEPADSRALVDTEELHGLQRAAERIRVDEAILDYVVMIGEATRVLPDVAIGISPRGSLALLRAAKSWALLEGRDYVLPDDVKAVATAALAHRLVMACGDRADRSASLDAVGEVLANVPVPR